MQPAGLAIYCPPTERPSSYADSASTPGQMADPTDRGGYDPRRPDCAGNGNDVTSSRDGQSSSSSSNQSVDDVSVARSSLVSDVSPSYVDRTASDFDAPGSDVTSAHNGYVETSQTQHAHKYCQINVKT